MAGDSVGSVPGQWNGRRVNVFVFAFVLAFVSAYALAAGSAGAVEFKRPPPKEGFSYPECFCTNRGERVELGGVVCLKVDGREFLARCEMSLNNPSWRWQSDGCPLTRLPPRPDAG